MKELSKTYNPSEIEDRLYKHWEESGYFAPQPSADGKPTFSIVIPPPNVTGQLHMGHALDETLQDILVRTKRMQGYDTLWVPGTDHAGIATQIKVEQELREKEGITRHDIGREAFLERVWDWKQKYGSRIITQLKKLGTSADFSRERFTMDEQLSKAVKKVFVSLYDKGLIYRGYRITNWCPHCITALSDAEVEHKDIEGNFWHIKYYLKDSDEFITIATTRPETMLGDTAVAVSPDDPEKQKYVGKTVIIPLINREIPIIADENVEVGFGTGFVKITPAHDPNDFETGQRHNLETIIVLDDNAKINENGGKYQGLDRFEARKQIVADLDAAGYLEKTEKCNHAVGHCYRCGTVLEPIVSKQWFVKMKPLAGPAIDIVKKGDVSYIPERFTKIYLNWMENIKDWCISRQLWWGHRIPAYYCDECGEMVVSETDVTLCPKCGSTHITQESDVLDTWFSSSLWPFSTMGWPDETSDLKKYYPTSVLVTGYDIITFWVSKMIFMGVEFMQEKPFSHVFIHGLVRDAQGRKMSKSLGNGIDPLEIIDKYGADALRFALATGNSPGNDMRFSDEKIEAARNFNNKIWNAARFVMMNLTIDKITLPDVSDLALEDKWILSKFNNLVSEVRENIDKYELGVALNKLYEFIWDIYCDWYIELAKPRLNDKGSKSNETVQHVLGYVLSNVMKLLHPYMPFITEEIWTSLPHDGDSIMISPYPEYSEKLSFKDDEESMERLIVTIRSIRARRAEMNVPPSKKAPIYIVSDYDNTYNKSNEHFFTKLASADNVIFTHDYTSDNALRIVTDSATVYIPLADIIDTEKESARLNAELKKNQEEIARLEKKLSNQGFIAKAPASVVEGEKSKLEKYRETLNGIQKALDDLKKI